jgi:microcystin-dependent protein
MTFWKWSKTAAVNGTADSSCSFPEGMAPSALNDGTRGMMAALAKYRDDTAGNGMVTSGTSTAYSLSSNQVFDSVAHMTGAEITIYAHATNGAAPTLNVDGLGAFPIYTDSGSPVQAGTLIVGSIYTLLFNTTQWLLKDFYGQPFTVPIGGMIDYFGTTAPSSNFVLPYGQAISRTTYSVLFSLLGTTYGTGDGTTTFNIPDLRGRIGVGKDDMGGSAASRLTTAGGGVDGATLGAAGGSQNVTLAANQIPTITATNASQAISVTSAANVTQNAVYISYVNAGGGGTIVLNSNPTNTPLTSTGNNSISATYTNGSQVATKTVQPAIVVNKLFRII